MWRHLLNLLEDIGSFRLGVPLKKRSLVVGQFRSTDFLGSFQWKQLLDPKSLSDLWGPLSESPWYPYHCITLFTVLDALDKAKIGPLALDPLEIETISAPKWLDQETLLFIDLKGARSVAWGAGLARVMPAELICTFNNWPDARGVLKPEQVLAALLRYGSLLAKQRVRIKANGPVLWLCDSNRLLGPEGKPGQFDNRYYLDDSLLAGPKVLKQQGIKRIVYLGETGSECSADLVYYFELLRKEQFLVSGLTVDKWQEGMEPALLSLPRISFLKSGFFRSSAGGFGATVPHPSSGG